MEDVLAEIQSDEGFTSILAVRIHGESYRCRRSERAAKRDESEEDGRYDPPIPFLSTPAVAHEADRRENCDRNPHYKSKFRLIYTTILPRQVANDLVRDFTCNCSPEDTTNKG